MQPQSELVVALKSGGRNIKLPTALVCIWGLRRRQSTLTRRYLQSPRAT